VEALGSCPVCPPLNPSLKLYSVRVSLTQNFPFAFRLSLVLGKGLAGRFTKGMGMYRLAVVWDDTYVVLMA